MSETWKGPEELRPLLMPVEGLRTHPDNPRRGDVELIARSLEAFGQLKPIIVHDLDGQTTIFAGNHTYRAAVEKLGWTHIAATAPAYLGADEAEAYLLMDNRASDLATYDYGELTELLEERADAGTLERTGFTPDDIAKMHADAAQLANAALDEFQAGQRDEDAGPPASGIESPRPPLRQVLLTFQDPKMFEEFAKRLHSLRKELATDDISATIAAVVASQFRKVWTG